MKVALHDENTYESVKLIKRHTSYGSMAANGNSDRNTVFLWTAY